jgi:acyl CoA:acetate/3-ketoacid CoA transferase
LKTRSLPTKRQSRISDDDAVSCSGFVGIGTPQELLTLERRFIETEELQLTDRLSYEECDILFAHFEGMAL